MKHGNITSQAIPPVVNDAVVDQGGSALPDDDWLAAPAVGGVSQLLIEFEIRVVCFKGALVAFKLSVNFCI